MDRVGARVSQGQVVAQGPKVGVDAAREVRARLGEFGVLRGCFWRGNAWEIDSVRHHVLGWSRGYTLPSIYL